MYRQTLPRKFGQVAVIPYGYNHVQVDKKKTDGRTGFGGKLRASIRHLTKKTKKSDARALTVRGGGEMTQMNEIQNSVTMTLMVPNTPDTPDGGDLGHIQLRPTVQRNMLHARKSMRPTLVEFEDAPVLGDLKAI